MHYYHVSFRVNGKGYSGTKESEDELENFYWRLLGQARDYFRTRAIEELEVLEYSQASHTVRQLLQERETVARRREQEEFTPFTTWQKALHSRKKVSRDDPPSKRPIIVPQINKSKFDTPERRAILEQIVVLARAALKQDSRVIVHHEISAKDGLDHLGFITFTYYNGVQHRKETALPGILLEELTGEQVQSIADRTIEQIRERQPRWFK